MGIGGVAAKDMRDGDVIFSLPLESRDAMTGEYTPLALTTELVRAVGGPLGECGRALAVTGAGRCSGRHIIRLTPGALKALEFNFLKYYAFKATGFKYQPCSPLHRGGEEARRGAGVRP